MLVFQFKAQNYIDMVRIAYSDTPLNRFDSSGSSAAITEASAELTMPLPVNDHLTVLTGMNYEMLETSLFPEMDPVRVHGIMLRLGASISHSERLKGNYLFLPKISSDLRQQGRRNFQFGALALFKRIRSSNFIWQYGAMVNTDLFGPFVVPLMGFHYLSPSRKFEANFLLPASADMNYAWHEKVQTGLQFVSAVRSYHLNDRIPGHPSAYWVKSTNEIYGYLQLKPIASLLVQARCGYSIGRRHYAYDSDDKIDLGIMALKIGDERLPLNPTFRDGMIFQIRMLFRIGI
jgi:hypothetical protein